MTATGVLLAIAVLLAMLDWIAVIIGSRPMEYVFKPATMVPLIIAAVTLDSPSGAMAAWFTVALVLSLMGDVFLMLPDDEKWFVPGLGSFLGGHAAYVVGLIVGGVTGIGLVIGVVVVVVLIALVAPRIIAGASAKDRRLGPPVMAYLFMISTMVACAIGSGVTAAIVGALFFYASDAAIGWSKFVKPFRSSGLFIIMTYHSAQMLLVVSLLVAR